MGWHRAAADAVADHEQLRGDVMVRMGEQLAQLVSLEAKVEAASAREAALEQHVRELNAALDHERAERLALEDELASVNGQVMVRLGAELVQRLDLQARVRELQGDEVSLSLNTPPQ